MTKPENLRTEETQINGVPVTVTSYKVGSRFYCHIANKDPGAVFVRTEAASKQEAMEQAIAKAKQRLAR
ncbi:hypothetical protein GWO43_07935 [candidate division KSB1 bacterium]|nr:hypothetical protein [candidate division KSB1 bacterium]NIS23899.1 hypothetical protein [candidate division KSB1 bacterium]NIT70816.1 hypothetical protein [candidate division KSB1 bacterium]NIU24548.1 hypothetical protein [candidate division KSB1 bacterium]NIU94502.1 hypothetical protein [candidate division KSB1 bacterium]